MTSPYGHLLMTCGVVHVMMVIFCKDWKLLKTSQKFPNMRVFFVADSTLILPFICIRLHLCEIVKVIIKCASNYTQSESSELNLPVENRKSLKTSWCLAIPSIFSTKFGLIRFRPSAKNSTNKHIDKWIRGACNSGIHI